MKLIEDAGRATPKVTRDYRTILDDPSVDGLVVATPDHWHALATVTACQAGKHVYVEKPISHNIVEGRLMVKAARRYNRVVQAGTQRRSSPNIAELTQFIQSGKIGPVHFARAWITSRRENIGHATDEPVPAGVDYDRWLGPAPSRPFNRNHFHYHWHWNWLYGTGELGNNGIHGLDLARQVLQLPPPTSVASTGGKHYFDDDQITPDTQWVSYQYPKLTLIWEHRTWSPRGWKVATLVSNSMARRGTSSPTASNGQSHGPARSQPPLAPLPMNRCISGIGSIRFAIALAPMPISRSRTPAPPFVIWGTSPSASVRLSPGMPRTSNSPIMMPPINSCLARIALNGRYPPFLK